MGLYLENIWRKFFRKLKAALESEKVWRDPYLYIALLSNVLIHYQWFFSSSVFTYGDAYVSFPEQLRQITSFQVWSASTLGGIEQMPSAYPYFRISGFLARIGLSYAVIQRIIFLWPIVIVGSIGSYLLVKKVSKSGVGGLVGSIIFNFNTFFIVATSNHILIAGAIAWVPLAMYLFLMLIDRPSFWRSFACAIPLAIIAALEFRILYVACFALLLLYFFTIREGREKKGIPLYTFLFFLPMAIALLLNAFWLAPYYGGGLQGGLQGVIIGRPLFTGGTIGTNLLHNSFAVFDPTWSAGKLIPFSVHSIPFYWFLVPLLAFSVLFFEKLRRNRFVLFFLLIALIGIFLGKFYFPPFPSAYEWLYNNFPGFNAFREPSKFTFLIYLPYAVLIGCLLGYLLRRVAGSRWRKGLILFLALLVSLPFLISVLSVATGSAGALFVPKQMPSDYEKLKSYLLSEADSFRTLWVPIYSRWSFYDDNHPRVSCAWAAAEEWKNLQDPDRKDTLNPENIVNILQRPFSAELLKDTSIKFVIVPTRDIENDDDLFIWYGGDRQFFVDQLDKLDYLEKVDIGTGELAIYRNKEYQPPVFLTNAVCGLNASDNIDSQYMLARSIAGRDLPFTLSSNPADTMLIKDLMPADGENSVSANGTIAEVPTSDADEDTSLYIDKGKDELHCSLEQGKLILKRTAPGILIQDGRPVNGSLNGQEVLGTANLAKGYDYWLAVDGVWLPLTSAEEMNLGEINRLSDVRLYRAGHQNIIPNGSFEEGLWIDEKIGRNTDDSSGVADVTLNEEEVVDGRHSLQLEANRPYSAACTMFPVEGSREYYLSFAYQSPNAQEAGYSIEFNDEAKTVIQEKLGISGASWHYFQRPIVSPPGATSATLHVYCYDSDSETLMITRYDKFELKAQDFMQEFDLEKFHHDFAELQLNPEDTNHQFEFKSVDSAVGNLVPNGSFEKGLWGEKVVDCSAYDAYPEIGMSLNTEDASDGSSSLQLEATRHVAGTYTAFSVEGNQEYSFSFDYQSPNAAYARYYILFNDRDKKVLTDTLPISGTDWQHFQRRLTAPLGATDATLYVYCDQTNGNNRIINKYDNFEFAKAPKGRGAFFAVSTRKSLTAIAETVALDTASSTSTIKKIKLDTSLDSSVLVLAQKYDSGWNLATGDGEVLRSLNEEIGATTQGVVGNDEAIEGHFELDGCLNAWLIKPREWSLNGSVTESMTSGTADMEATLEFEPQTHVRVGSALSYFILLGGLALAFGWLIWSCWMRTRRQWALRSSGK